MLEFAFIRPKTLSDALKELERHHGEWKVLAGGTDLLPSVRQRWGEDPVFRGVVDITGLKELRGVWVQDDVIAVGSLTTFSDIMGLPQGIPELDILARMSSEMGSVQIRNRATVGGNLVNASACADSVPPLLALDAFVELASVEGTRALPLEEFISAPGETKIKPPEVLTRIYFPRCKLRAEWSYMKMGRRNSGARSRMTIAVLRLATERDGWQSRIAIGAVTPTAMRLRSAEHLLDTAGWNSDTICRCAGNSRAEVEAVTGARWSSAYKLPVIENVMRRVLGSVIRREVSSNRVVTI